MTRRKNATRMCENFYDESIASVVEERRVSGSGEGRSVVGVNDVTMSFCLWMGW